MKVTYQTKTTFVDLSAIETLKQLKQHLRTDIEGLPPQFDLLYQTEQATQPILVENEEHYGKMQKISKEAKVHLTVNEQLDSEGEYEIIGDEEDEGMIELKDGFEEELSSGQMDAVISEKLEKMMPGVMEKIRREIRSQAKNAGSENPFSSALVRFWVNSAKSLLEEYEKVMKRIAQPVQTIEEVHEMEVYLLTKMDEEISILEKEQTKLLQLWELIKKN